VLINLERVGQKAGAFIGEAVMAQRQSDRLVPRMIGTLKEPGMYPDGHGLYLLIGPNGARSWIFRYKFHKRRHEMGLGGFPLVSLAEAREVAKAYRRQLHDGFNPLEQRRAQKQAAKLEAAKRMTFKQCAETYVAETSPAWKNWKHAAQWSSTLEAYAYPVFGDLPVQAIDTALIVTALRTIWQAKPETASRLRGRIERILDYARVSGYRAGENPARWRGHLDKLLQHRSKLRRTKHHAALPYGEIAGFMRCLQEQDSAAAGALQFTILTASRTSEVRGACFDEVDFAAKEWAIPGPRIKSGKPHRVPLSRQALRIIETMQKVSSGPYIFPGAGQSGAMGAMAMLQLLKRMGRSDLTVHGFRSTFRDWVAEQTPFPSFVAEAALAHAVADKVEAAYRRGELIKKRRELMDAWASYCYPEGHGDAVNWKRAG
jgi:integrase